MSDTVPGWLNHTMKFVLRSPMHPMVSGKIALITFTGRKSGKSYTTPVSYLRQGDTVYIFTHGRWWRNLSGGRPVMLRLRGKNLTGTAQTETEDKDAIAAKLTEHLRHNHFDAKYYHVTYGPDGEPNADEVRAAVETVVLITVTLDAA